jgi:hypothetical protein
MENIKVKQLVIATLVCICGSQSSLSAQSIAVEADAAAYFLKGYSGIVRWTAKNGFNVALGTGRYNVPGFILKNDSNYKLAEWKANSESIQVFRVGYRFNGPMKNGLAVDGIVINQNWKLRSAKLGGESNFRPIGVGASVGYYFHIGKHFYIYPTGSFTYNTVYSGQTQINGTDYHVSKWQPNGSVHVGWEFGK